MDDTTPGTPKTFDDSMLPNAPKLVGEMTPAELYAAFKVIDAADRDSDDGRKLATEHAQDVPPAMLAEARRHFLEGEAHESAKVKTEPATVPDVCNECGADAGSCGHPVP